MAYFPDMTVCTYFHSPAQSEWACRLMAIGWLESGHEFSVGVVDSRIAYKFAALRSEFRSMFPEIAFRGLHACSICKDNAPLSESHTNLFIPTTGFVYVAPGRIDHYIEEHRYAPPEHFVEAVVGCPGPKAPEYRAAMSAANRGFDVPLFRR
jgi:hypothetical protein